MGFLDTIQSIFSSKPTTNGIISSMSQGGYNYIGSSLGSCGDFKISKNTIYALLKTNTIVSSIHKRMSARVGRRGFQLLDMDGNVVENPQTKKIKEVSEYFFSSPTFYHFIFNTLGQIIGSGQVFGTATELNGTAKATKKAKANIYDSRIVEIILDKNGDIERYEITGENKIIKMKPQGMVDLITYMDFDNTIYGSSPLESIIKDAIIDSESAGRQMMYFQNSAVPNSIISLDPTVVKTTEALREAKSLRNETFRGTKNSSKALMSNSIKDVKILEMTNQEIQLIEQRLYADKKIAVALGIDLRLLGYMKDTGSAFSDISFTTYHANEQIKEYAGFIELLMKMMYEQFFEKMPYKFELVNQYYNDVSTEKEINMKEVERGIITRNEYREMRGELVVKKDEYMDQHTVNGTITVLGQPTQTTETKAQ